jgi:hypothetical protein
MCKSIAVLLLAPLAGLAIHADARGNAISLGPGSFLPTAVVFTFEDQNDSLLPVNPDFEILREGTINTASWFDGSTQMDEPAFPATMFGSANFENVTNLNTSNFAIRFTNVQPAVGLWVGRTNNFIHDSPDSITFKILDDGGNLIASQVLALPSLGSGPAFVGFASDVGIRRAEVIGDLHGFFGVDNITYGLAAIPEPSSLVLAGLGFVGLAAWGWRRQGAMRKV